MYIKIYDGIRGDAPIEKERIAGLSAVQVTQLGEVFSRHGVLHEAGEE